MKKNGLIQRRPIHAAVVGALAALAFSAGPVFADATSDLKAEIAAQRAQLEEQRLRLEAMERKLDATAAQQAASAEVAKAQPAETRSWIPQLLASEEPGFKFQVTPVDTVTLYGLFDATLSDVSNANAAGSHKRSMQTPWFSGDRWGITGRHGIHDNTVGVIWKLESEFDYRTGEEDTAGVLFNRDAWIGFGSDTFGKVTFGRQNAIARDFSGIYGDPYGSARVTLEEGGYTNTNNFKQLIFYAASATGTRVDRGVVWKKYFGPVVVGAQYAFGGVTGDSSRNTSKAIALGFNAPGDVFHLAGFVNDFDVNGLKHKEWSLGGNVALGSALRLNAGYYKENTEQGGNVGKRKDHALTVSLKITPPGPMEYDVGYQILHADNAGVTSAGFVLRPYQDSNSVTRTVKGDAKTAYGSLFYHFDRRAEVYLVGDYLKLKDGYNIAVVNGHDKQVEFGVGMRVRF